MKGCCPVCGSLIDETEYMFYDGLCEQCYISIMPLASSKSDENVSVFLNDNKNLEILEDLKKYHELKKEYIMKKLSSRFHSFSLP